MKYKDEGMEVGVVVEKKVVYIYKRERERERETDVRLKVGVDHIICNWEGHK